MPAELSELELRWLAHYGQFARSPVLAWLPVGLGLLAAAAVAAVLCPAAHYPPISGAGALLIAAVYVMATAAAAVITLLVLTRLVSNKGASGRITFSFLAAAAWIAPVTAFYSRRSMWAVSMAAVLAALSATLIHRRHLEIRDAEASGDLQLMDGFRSANLAPMAMAAMLLQVTAMYVIAGRARPASASLGAAVFLIAWFRRAAIPSDSTRSGERPLLAGRSLLTAGLAFVFVAVSLTPYLAAPMVEAAPGGGAYFALQALFGDDHAGEHHAGGDEAAAERESISSKRKSDKGSTAIVAGDSYSGMILRPELKDHVTIVPPLPTRRVFDRKPNRRKMDPVAIPFYGAYWFYRTSERRLPGNAVESRGNPAAISFRTTDFSPISMEARQNFGTLIELSCCRAIEVVISNGDRRPNTVSVELILVNTRLAGRPRQSLGVLPVNSTQTWRPGDDRPPVEEVLRFPVQAQAGIQTFDEAIIRYELSHPRTMWSAKIAIDRFRLIPRGL